MRRGVIAVALLLTAIVAVSANSQTPFTAVRRLIQDGLAKDSAPGLAIAVARGDSILWEEGFGWADPEKRIPVTVNTPFYLASLTKTITATALMILRERGRLDLDRSANDYLGAAKLWSPRWNAAGATVRHLATHRSGLTTFDLQCPPSSPTCPFPSIDELIRRYGVLTRPPGESFDYSNLGYDILGDVAARAAGKDFGAFLRDEIFTPLRMTHSTFGVDATSSPPPAVPYAWVRGRMPHSQQKLAGSTGYSSVHDLVRFGQMHVKAQPRGARVILSDTAIDTMQLSTVPAGSRRYGIGWWVDETRFGYRSLLAQGGTPGAQTWLRIIPAERIVVVVLANKGVTFAGDVVDAAIAELLPRYAAGMQAATPPGQASSAPGAPVARLDTSVVGAWSGEVLTETGEVKMQITVSDSGAVRAMYSTRPGESPGRARFSTSSGLVRLNITGDLDSADSTQGQRLFFYLRPGNGVMNGAVTMGVRRGSPFEGRISYWVELRRSSVDRSTLRALPVRYLADRFAVTPVTDQGDTLVLYTDTGGGTSRLEAETVRRIGIVPERVVQGRDTLSVVSLPPFISTATIPPPSETPPIGQRLLVTTAQRVPGRDGLLGRMWFVGRVWVFDYPRRSLALVPVGSASAVDIHHLVPLGFKVDSAGHRTRHFPRIRVAVDGDSLDLLFDTGATASLSDSARVILAAWHLDGPAERGTSFIAQSVFDRWRARHPNWRVIERADLAFGAQWPMIEVPLLAVAGYAVGPVWFTVRSTQSWQGMSTAMDAPIEGALGGSALKYFRITVDYPNATALFERP